MFLEQAVDDINNKLEVLDNGSNVVLWGAGENAVRLFQYTRLLAFNQLQIVDKTLFGQTFFGKIVRKPEDILWDSMDAVIVSAFVGADEISMELAEKYDFKGHIILIHENLKVPFYSLGKKKDSILDDNIISILQKNSRYKNMHEGERGFILCTGPSIAEMELTRLKDEKTIAVSGFYLHKDCQTISPDYYCLPTFENFLDFDSATEYLRKIQEVTLKSQYFFSLHEKQVIDKMREYDNRCVNYVAFASMPDFEKFDIELTSLAPAPQSVSIMALEIALYMGFKKIYLIGTEHDCLQTKRYTHFYDYSESIVSQNNQCENEQGDLGGPFDLELESLYNLWRQYKKIKQIAERNGAEIYNATRGGVLDVFERVDFDTLF